ncbi:MAG: bifunctional phosphoribosylaminoimidazolecarboxamide formyltransferase/IMP cyclohydrolase [Planctomycetes bacterium]|nr:bifunctional phosphoribosylaminoimidazolecarboxamide formyltransferase/IMP cyclohydrolase [Planctomycetota bacterium]
MNVNQSVKIKRALLSVSDKTGLVEFAKALADRGVEIISTGGTAETIKNAGIAVVSIDQVTHFPEMMDGRVKTLHPKIHAGILAVRDNDEHQQAMIDHEITPIDLVCINLYPFEKTIAKKDCTFDDAIENIDIGGPAMVRSAAKNHRFVAVLTDPDQYTPIIEELSQQDSCLSGETRSKLAAKAFALTAAYDCAVSNYLKTEDEPFPQKVTIALERIRELRYGENPHQLAAFYRVAGVQHEPTVANARQLPGGKQISFNNLADADAALELVREFDQPAAILIKHTNPCGVAVDSDITEAYRKAYIADTTSAFGSIVAFNRPVTEQLAQAVMESFPRWGKALGAGGFFAEVIIAPSFDPAAVELLRNGKRWAKEDLRLLETGPLAPASSDINRYDLKGLNQAVLLQQPDTVAWEPDLIKVVTKTKPTDQQLADLKLAWIVAKHVKSNTIVLAKDNTIVGVGAGQMNRLDSGMLAIRQAKENAKGAAMASDAFFPFPDNITQAANAHITAIAQPGGSKNDPLCIAEADKLNIPMIFTQKRHFKH